MITAGCGGIVVNWKVWVHLSNHDVYLYQTERKAHGKRSKVSWIIPWQAVGSCIEISWDESCLYYL